MKEGKVSKKKEKRADITELTHSFICLVELKKEKEKK